jgi:uncharacterized membrane protein
MVVRWAIPLAALAAYYATLYPSVPGGDSGELLTCVCNWGTAHPPGYPLWTMLAAMWSLAIGTAAPDTNVAWRVNLFSAVCNAAASFVIALTTERVLASRTANASRGASALLPSAACCGGLAAAVFAFSPGIWLYVHALFAGATFSATCSLARPCSGHAGIRFSRRCSV